MGRKTVYNPKYPDSQGEFFPGVTIADAVDILNCHHNTIRMHIDRGTLRARKSNRVWIIDLESIRQLPGHSSLYVSSMI